MADLFQILVTPVSKQDDTALVAGTVDFYSPGTTGESNRKDVFTDQGGTIASANPITLDAQATAAVYGVGQFHIVIKDASENVVYDYDYITPQQTGIIIYEVQEVHVATAGQTVFDLTQSYNPSTLSNGIAVYVEGNRQNPDVYTETDADTITFDSGITEDDEVMFVINFYDTAAEGVGTVIAEADAKAVPILADIIAILDSESSDALKQSTINQILNATLLFPSKTTPIVADSMQIIDSEDSDELKLITLQKVMDMAIAAVLASRPLNVLNMKVVDIGDWDMDADDSINVTHGVADFKKIRSVSVIIRDDVDTNYAVAPAPNTIGTDCNLWVSSVVSTVVALKRKTGVAFDDPGYATPPDGNRGWVTIWYAD